MNNILKLIAVIALFSTSLRAGDIDNFLKASFPENNPEQIEVSVLKGGLSSASMYKVVVQGKEYVLRVHSESAITDQDKLEISLLLKASKEGVSPKVIAVSEEGAMVLMQFIDRPTMTVDEAKETENIIALAKVLKKVHAFPFPEIKGEGLFSKASRCFKKVLEDKLVPAEDIQTAYDLVKKYTEQLEIENFSVLLHGDLNLRNIFSNQKDILLIDWAEASLGDPLMDLSYLSLKAAYSKEEEELLLTTYFGKPPSEKILRRFDLHKKRHHAFWSLTDLYLAEVDLQKNQGQKINPMAPLKSWYYYQKQFAEGKEVLQAQYFVDLSRLNLRLAK